VTEADEGGAVEVVDDGAVTREPLWLWPKALLPCAAASTGKTSIAATTRHESLEFKCIGLAY
jgi:hypothetical protein